tara:strand:+ start:327 stop:488 length:162 start_codon:yes stop_codon:yes gene_type:complete
MKSWEHQRELDDFTHQCGNCYIAGDCYCNDFTECCGFGYEKGDACKDCNEVIE